MTVERMVLPCDSHAACACVCIDRFTTVFFSVFTALLPCPIFCFSVQPRTTFAPRTKVKLRTVRASTSSSDERVATKYEQSGGSQTDHEEAGNEARVGTTTLHRLGWARDRAQHSAETDDSDVDGAALGCPLGPAPTSPCRLLVPGCTWKWIGSWPWAHESPPGGLRNARCACGRWLLQRGQRADEAAARSGRQGCG
jgi:hypothetical protein